MLNAAKKKAEELGIYAPIIASSPDDIEARPFGETLACVAQEVECYSRPFKPPCIMICGGELLVTVGKSTGCGGRNQEFALATAPKIEGSKKIVVASVDSDGTDGPTEMAGGIVDGYTMERAKKTEVDVAEELANHNSYAALKKLEDNILTGARGTNVQDLTLVYIARIPDHHSKSIRVQGLY
jgi:glycerate 2-kinase